MKKMYVSVLAILIGAQSYGATVGATDDVDCSRVIGSACSNSGAPAVDATGADPVAKVQRHCKDLKIITRFLDIPSLVALSQTGTAMQRDIKVLLELPSFKLDWAIFSKIAWLAKGNPHYSVLDALSPEDRLFLEATYEERRNQEGIGELSDRTIGGMLDAAIAAGSVLAIKHLNVAAAKRRLGFDFEQGVAYLQSRAQEGDTDAQQKLNMLAYNNVDTPFLELNPGMKVSTGLAYLLYRSYLQDIDAQQKLNMLAYNNVDTPFLALNPGLKVSNGLAYLLDRSYCKDTNAQQMLNRVAKDKGDLPFLRPGESGFAYLRERIRYGDQDAQSKLNNVGVFLSDDPTGRTFGGLDDPKARAYLEGRAAEGDKNAQQILNDAALSGCFGFDQQKGRKHLEDCAAAGDTEAQKILNHAATQSVLGFNMETGKRYLFRRALLGDPILLGDPYLDALVALRWQYRRARM